MATEHEKAVKAATQTNDELAHLFAQLGTTQHPRGALLSAYRQARRALKGNVNDIAVIEEVLLGLRVAVEDALRYTFQNSVALGNEQAGRELAAYGLPAATRGLEVEIENALKAVIGLVEAQAGAVRVLRDEKMLLGDQGRVGLMSPAAVIREGARHTTNLTTEAHRQATEQGLTEGGAKAVFLRQAIAGIDERTTETCLRVHTQTATLDGNFKLTGTPRFADELHAPPFHWYCRTAVALVHRLQADDDLTRQMRDAARAELRAREETGERVEIHPASALSRR